MAKILLVEDEPDLSEPIKLFLESQDHLIDVINDGTEAAEKLKYYQYDVIILDWVLPGVLGVEICRQYRQNGGTTPILMLTAKSNTQEKVKALDAGADDYLTKPFDLNEVSARIRALLRRPTVLSSNILKARNLVVEPESYRVIRNEKEVQLLPKEFALLAFFMRHPNQVFSPEALLDRVWASDSDASPETIRTYVKRLRQKIDVEGEPSIISTVHGVGYKLEA